MRHRSRPRHRLAPPDRPRPSAAELTAPALRTRTFVSRHDSWTPPSGGPRTNGKSLALVPLPTIPLPNVDSPFPRLPEPRLADALASILDAPQPTTHPTEFRFEWTHEAAAHNLAVLRRYALDLGAAVDAQPFSAVTPGSEFRSAALLAPLLSAHPLWSRFQERISDGADFPLREISDADRLADVRDNLARGNHKSARGHEAKLISMLKEEVERGWQLPLPRGGRSGIRRLRGGAFGHGGTDIDRREGTDHREAKAHTTSHSTPAGSQDEA
ncbi:hypothetical protein MHU86_12689 [Fragilaria crotonensis]|nr:hypothetical protein MHU86_12689 [Fragilaria crotonensis]